MPRISVIVPAFNYGRYLSEALDSVRAQSFADWECIIVDDGSTDDTGAIARSYATRDARFIYVYQDNKGLSASRNTGLRHARGKYIQLLDADDLIKPQKLLKQMKFLDSHPDCAGVYGGARYFKDTADGRCVAIAGRDYHREKYMAFPSDRHFQLSVVAGNVFPVSAPLFRRSLVEEIGQFDVSLPSHEDWDFWLRISLAGKRFAWLGTSETETLIREHGQRLTRKQVVMSQTKLAVRRRIAAATNDEEILRQNQAWLNYDRCVLGAVYIKTGHPFLGLQAISTAFLKAESKLQAARLFVANVIPAWCLWAFRFIRSKLVAD